MKSVLFIHRSVGRNLLRDGSLREQFEAAMVGRGMRARLDDYDSNTRLLTRGPTREKWVMPGDNTNPDNLVRLLVGEMPKLLDRVMEYDLVVVKSCYPNNAISRDDQLALVKGEYGMMGRAFEQWSAKQLVILATPPLRPSRTNAAEARRARELADWLVGTKLAPNVSVFDLYGRLAAREGAEAGMLKRAYRRWWPWDSHPNAAASRKVVPQIVEFLVEAMIP